MTTPTRAEVSRLLADLFDAERSVRHLHAELAKAEPPTLLDSIDAAAHEALDLGDADESALRLVRLASLLGELEGPRPVDLLIDILGSEEPEARHTAGESLEDLAFDRFKEVALGVERALDRLPSGNSALLELPYLLGGIGEPGVRKLLARFLAHEDPEAVAAAIEVLVDTGDTGAASLLAPLERDTRRVSLEDEEGEEGTATLGELAIEAKKLLAEIADAREPVAGPAPRAREGSSRDESHPRTGRGSPR
jgi:HEAT repeat protein